MAFEYGPIPSSKYEEAILHLRHNFPDEPLNVSVGFCKLGQALELLEHHYLKTLQDGLSVMAVDVETGEIAGVALNGISRRGENEEGLKSVNASDNPQYRLIFGLLLKANSDLDLYKMHDVDKIFELRILSVASRYRGRGLAKELFMRSEIIAEEHGFQMIKVDATSQFTQKVCESFGLATVKSLRYRDFKDEDGKMLYQTEPPHDFFKIMMKQLPSQAGKE